MVGARPCMILCRPPWEDLVKIQVKSFVHELVQVLMRRSCWNHLRALEVLTWSCTGPCEKIMCRSCSNHFKSSLQGPCIKILQLLCIRGACMEVLLRCSQGVLVWRFWNMVHIGHSLTILQISLRCPGLRFRYEVLPIELLVCKALGALAGIII